MKFTTNADVAVLIGRFQPFHNGHAALLRMALAAAPEVIVVIGSSYHARSPKNPFTWQERSAMINETLTEEERARVSTVAVRDYYEDARWAAAVQVEVTALATRTRNIALIGHFKDASSAYLNLFPKWDLISVTDTSDIDATVIRRVLFEADNIDVSLAVIADMLPIAVRQYLKAWALRPNYPPLVDEHKAVEAYKAAWRSAPYAPVFTTVDAVVKTANHVLLVQRGAHPGKGLWALPGGFLEQRERLLQAAIRELCEETKLGILASSLASALIDVKVFDHPDRSLRGRTITHAHFFDLRIDHLPCVEGADDAAHATWAPIENLRSMEEHFFDDHFHILNCFLRLTEEK